MVMSKMSELHIKMNEQNETNEPSCEEPFDINKVDNYEIEGVDSSDYPDFCDAFIVSADYDGRECTDIELDYIMDNYPEIVNELAFESLIP